MQLMAFLEDGSKATAFIPGIFGIPETYAIANTDYSARSPIIKGDSLGILLGTGLNTNQPVQELLTIAFTGIDIVNTSTGYTAVFSKTDSISGTGSKLIAIKASMTSVSAIPRRDPSLVGYWDMETFGSDGKLSDLSGNGNSGTPVGTTTVTGKNGNARSFNGTSDYITIPS